MESDTSAGTSARFIQLCNERHWQVARDMLHDDVVYHGDDTHLFDAASIVEHFRTLVVDQKASFIIHMAMCNNNEHAVVGYPCMRPSLPPERIVCFFDFAGEKIIRMHSRVEHLP